MARNRKWGVPGVAVNAVCDQSMILFPAGSGKRRQGIAKALLTRGCQQDTKDGSDTSSFPNEHLRHRSTQGEVCIPFLAVSHAVHGVPLWQICNGGMGGLQSSQFLSISVPVHKLQYATIASMPCLTVLLHTHQQSGAAAAAVIAIKHRRHCPE